jgi:glucosylceramidase
MALVLSGVLAALGDGAPTLASHECNVRKEKYGDVCLCTEQHCDSILPLPKALNGSQYVVYTSTKAGLRMQQTIGTVRNHSVKQNKRTIMVDEGTKYQKLLGFGNALTDAAILNYNKMNAATQTMLLEQYWGTNGTRFNVGRVPISSTDFSTHVYSYDDVPGDLALDHFSIDVDRDMGKLDFIKKVLELNTKNMSLFASSWAPPAWMTQQNRTTKNPTLKDGPTSATAQSYAHYLVKFFEEYAAEGIHFWGLTAQNEPAGNTGAWQDLKFTPAQQRDFIKTCLGPSLRASAVTKDIHLMMLDDQRIHLPLWTKTILSDKDAAQYISGIGLHWYAATEDILPSALYFGLMNKTHHHFPGFFMLATEACEGFLPWSQGPRLGDWARAETYAHDIAGDLNNFAIGWTDWNAFLDLQGGPNWAKNECDAPILLDTENGTRFYKQPMYYALAHFSAFLPAGSQRIAVDSRSASVLEAPMECTGFVTPEGDIVVVVLNRAISDSPIPFSIRFRNDVGQDTWIDLTAPSHSLQTVVWPRSQADPQEDRAEA